VIEHGGNAPEGWLDLSTGVSPFAYPVDVVEPRAWHRLPSESAAFRRVAAAYYGSDRFIAVPGSQAAIQLLPRLLPARSVAIASPTYGEHERCWRATGAKIELVPEEAIDHAPHDVVIVCNPNNPTGRWHGGTVNGVCPRWLIVDEAFIDTRPELSLAPHAGEPGLVALRSLGKFFGLAGARVGFLFAPQELLARAREALGPWPVCGPSLCVAGRALADREFCDSARTKLKSASARLQRLLVQRGFDVGGATDFFVWVKHPAARELQGRMAAKGILVRAFDEPPSVRFGLPGAEAEWQRLEDALAAL
jgi:cobalamin biosynthetic protein CobC